MRNQIFPLYNTIITSDEEIESCTQTSLPTSTLRAGFTSPTVRAIPDNFQERGRLSELGGPLSPFFSARSGLSGDCGFGLD